jgi:predicted signal transduction protein with EAL and GGDEF domain
MLKSIGCEFAQGYLFSKPVSAEAVSALRMQVTGAGQEASPSKNAEPFFN